MPSSSWMRVCLVAFADCPRFAWTLPTTRPTACRWTRTPTPSTASSRSPTSPSQKSAAPRAAARPRPRASEWSRALSTSFSAYHVAVQWHVSPPGARGIEGRALPFTDRIGNLIFFFRDGITPNVLITREKARSFISFYPRLASKIATSGCLIRRNLPSLRNVAKVFHKQVRCVWGWFVGAIQS